MQLVLVLSPPILRGDFLLKMKTLYTILFFASTLLLIFLTFYLFKIIDKGVCTRTLVLTLSGMALSIGFLVFFLYRYTKVPLPGSDR